MYSFDCLDWKRTDMQVYTNLWCITQWLIKLSVRDSLTPQQANRHQLMAVASNNEQDIMSDNCLPETFCRYHKLSIFGHKGRYGPV